MVAARYLLVVACLALPGVTAADPLPGFRPGPWFGEQVREVWMPSGVRVVASTAGSFDPKRPTRLVVCATPNGSSIEQTLGSATTPGTEWRFDIQHVAAQVRTLRAEDPGANLVLAVAEAEGLSWPAWKRSRPDGPARVRAVVETVRGWVPGTGVRVSLAGHSGGGSFLLGYLDGGADVPAEVERFVFLDANYSVTDAHTDRLLGWLTADASRRLTVVAYDDRRVTLDGKPVVGPDGGTFRATERMRSRLAGSVAFVETAAGGFVSRAALGGRLALHVHTNPDNRILHTALVGEMNGLLRGLTDGPPAGPRAYTKWVQPAAGIPPRPADAIGGAAFFARIASMPPADREAAVVAELLRGNLPDFLRTFHPVTVKTEKHTATFEVMPDYLAVGSDADFVRVPITPATACRVAEVFGCALPTRKVVDEVYRAAAVKLDPRPLTERREAADTFLAHHRLIEGQRAGHPLGRLVAGVKKDVVVTNRLGERPDRVAIYGWHRLDGTPIQPLNVSHVNRYVDYSHGVRLMRRVVQVDGKPRDVRHVLISPELSPLLSDEGPITIPTY